MRPLRFGFGLLAVCVAFGLLDEQVRAECHHAPISTGSSAGIPGGRSNLSPFDALRQAVALSEAAETLPTDPSQAPEVPCLRCTHTPVSSPSPTLPRLDTHDDLMSLQHDNELTCPQAKGSEESLPRYCSPQEDVPVPPPRPLPGF